MPKIHACRKERETRNGLDVEGADYTSSKALREAIHRREESRCFYCFKFLRPRMRALDHVVARAIYGQHSYRNLVSCCTECNSRKGEMSAANFLRQLLRENRLHAAELDDRMRAVQALKEGKLKPVFVDEEPLPGRIRVRRKVGAPPPGHPADA